MTVVPFPGSGGVLQPVVEVFAPAQGTSGLFEAYVWKNRDRLDGFVLLLQTEAQVQELLAIVKGIFEGGADG